MQQVQVLVPCELMHYFLYGKILARKKKKEGRLSHVFGHVVDSFLFTDSRSLPCHRWRANSLKTF